MEALDIISEEQAKTWLSAPDTTELERLIKAAINFVETYTGHTLITKQIVKRIPCNGYALKPYPIVIASVKNGDGEDVQYEVVEGYKTYIYAPKGSYVTMTVGYATIDDIPPILVEVAYKMLTYLYENRDIYPANLPLDYQMMVNKLRRNII